MWFLLLLIGLVFKLNGVTWFPGEETVGTIALVVAAIPLAIMAVIALIGAVGVGVASRR